MSPVHLPVSAKARPKRALSLAAAHHLFPRADLRPAAANKALAKVEAGIIKIYKSAVQTKNRDQQRATLVAYAGSHSICATVLALNCSKHRAKEGRTLSRVGLSLGIRKTSSTVRRRLERSKVDFLQAFALRNIELRAFSRTQKFEVLRTLNRNRLHAKYCRECEAGGVKPVGKTVFWAYLRASRFSATHRNRLCA
ncbi:hypothetical protein T484DRAFT_1890657 [Baffinella frigidus]|nr:hypothetical protein T484DRAFT_1890657 [Cryptophyta sp. CCMP2293]